MAPGIYVQREDARSTYCMSIVSPIVLMSLSVSSESKFRQGCQQNNTNDTILNQMISTNIRFIQRGEKQMLGPLTSLYQLENILSYCLGS